MTCEMLIRAADAANGGVMKKGYPSIVRDLPWEWGTKEGLPNWIRLRIIDAIASEVDFWMTNWTTRYVHAVLADTPSIVQIKIEVDPNEISLTGHGRNQLKTAAQAWAEEEQWNGTVNAITPSEMIVTLPKPVDINEAMLDFADRFDEVLEVVQFYFSGADVDAAVLAGGTMIKTKIEALAMVNDKKGE